MPKNDFNGFICDGSEPKKNPAYQNLSYDCEVLLDDNRVLEAVLRFSDFEWYQTRNARRVQGIVVGWRYL